MDLVSGAGLDAAPAGAEAAVDVSNRTALGRGRAVACFGAVSRNLLDGEGRAGALDGAPRHAVPRIRAPHLQQMPKPLAVVPRMNTRPVAAREVARHLVELVPARGWSNWSTWCAGPAARRSGAPVEWVARTVTRET
ncbi:hypothetical protein ACIQM3_08630 [Streptomyces sp. NPDC091271]|uniref:hypothetical protein n=1 Tax=Streptomyces sp. NPDC091271 TaxID=3365980 RepID=UPI00381942D7